MILDSGFMKKGGATIAENSLTPRTATALIFIFFSLSFPVQAAFSDGLPACSPDERAVAFCMDAGTASDGSIPFVVSAAKLDAAVWNAGWAYPARLGRGRFPAWVSGGKAVAFAAADPAGKTPGLLTKLLSVPFPPASGKKISVFTAADGSVIDGLGVVPTTGDVILRLTASGAAKAGRRSPGSLLRVNIERGATDVLVKTDSIIDFAVDPGGEYLLALDDSRGLIKVSLGVPVEITVLFAPEKVRGRDRIIVSPSGGGRCLLFSEFGSGAAPLLLSSLDAGGLLVLAGSPTGEPGFGAGGAVISFSCGNAWIYDEKKKKWTAQPHPSGKYAAICSPVYGCAGSLVFFDRRGLVVSRPAEKRAVAVPFCAEQALAAAKMLVESDRLSEALRLSRKYRSGPAATVLDEQAAVALWELEAYLQYRAGDAGGARFAAKYALLSCPLRDSSVLRIQGLKSPPYRDLWELLDEMADAGMTDELLSGIRRAHQLEESGKYALAGKYYENLEADTGDPLLQAGLAFRRGFAYLAGRKVLPAAKGFDDAATVPGFPQADLAAALVICCQWLHPDKKWQKMAMENASQFETDPPAGPRRELLRKLKSHLEGFNRRAAPETPEPLEVVVPGGKPTTESREGAKIQGPPEPDGSVLAVTTFQYSVTASPFSGPGIVLQPVTSVYWKLPDGRSGKLSLPMVADGMAVRRDSATAVFLARKESSGRKGAVACAVSLPDNKVFYGPFFFPGAVSVGLGESGFELHGANEEIIRTIPFVK